MKTVFTLVFCSLLLEYNTISPRTALWRIIHRRPSVPTLSLLRLATARYRRAEPVMAPSTKRIFLHIPQLLTQKRTYRLGRLNPKEFREWFLREYLKEGPKNRFFFTTPPPIELFTRGTTTETRISHYYEPYWFSGHWVFTTRVDPGSYEYNMNYSYVWNTSLTAKGDWTTWRHCVPVCLAPYKDYGAVCASRLVTGATYWRYEYADFEDLCQINHINCAYYYASWQVLHRGKCPGHYLNDTQQLYLTFNDMWTPETLVPKYVWWIPSKAAQWASIPYSPIRQRVPPLVPYRDFTPNFNDFRRRMSWTWRTGNVTRKRNFRRKKLKRVRTSKFLAKLAKVTPSIKTLRRSRNGGR